MEAEKLRLLILESNSDSTTNEHKTFEEKEKTDEWKLQWFRKIEKTLDDAQIGPIWLKDGQVAKVVADSMHYLDGIVYRLEAYCIMANHIHVVFAPLPIHPSTVAQTFSLRNNNAHTKYLCYNTLSSIMQSLKGYTARKLINS